MSLSFEPLTPLSFLDRAATVHGDRLAVVDGEARLSYEQLHERCRRLAGAVRAMAAPRPVAVLARNTHVLLEAHYGVPWAGVPLVALNTRLSPGEIGYILDHSEAGVLVYEEPFAAAVEAAVASMSATAPRLVRAEAEYEDALGAAEPFAVGIEDETSLLSINYTSGTTGRPKGVMYHHRGAYLQALAMVVHSGLTPASVQLWTLPMFHCNGWCFPWAVTAAGARHVCLPQVDAGEIWRLVDEEGVTHFNGAPTVLSMVAYAPEAERHGPRDRRIQVCTGGAPPTPTILDRMASLGVDVTHLYGLTETFGPAMVCEWRPEWNSLDGGEQATIKARQGVGNVIACRARVVDQSGEDVPADGATVGEIALRGNNVMLGYLKDPEATAAAAPDGWFRTGDLGVMHESGYVELRDRSKDVIISGGENIASVEVEHVIATHPAVLEVAVIAEPDERWGEVPAAYVTLQLGQAVSEDELIAHVRARLARFKAPKRVYFTELPKTSTGKIQKYVLREAAWAGRDKRIS